ncbi:integrase catalytic domain-containing protein [Trichonephila inaurata madagascariensis]|uniref:Integrase catalytic domain-containing protein n=1 Tax=Trichonephila inaurata madagascariensis TaxID=2747483 RepID=A0A8X7CD17_9ARAC|nr:integrase catalytic domain-containing protein [Trichonephila inaurata madagascariensis]
MLSAPDVDPPPSPSPVTVGLILEDAGCDRFDGSTVSVENSTTASSSSSNVSANQACTSEVLLQTLAVVLQNGNHKSLVRALIDTGSQKSYILKSTAEKLAFKNEGEEEFIHSLFGGTKTKMYRHKCYKICLTNVDNNYTCNLNVYDQEMICNDVPSIRHGPWINELKNRKINLSDRGHNLGGKIEILIGADVAGKLLTGTMFYLKSGPVAIKTKLGWTLMGKTYRNKTKFDNNHFMNVTSMFVNDMCISDLWNLKDDCLSCKINCQKIEGKAITKRSLLSIANPIFDPIGFTAPVTLKPKLILQEIWKLKLKWDENLPENILNQVKQWLEQLPILAGIKIPRYLNLSSNGIKQIALHVFCDASKKAYAACVFLRVEYEENVFVKLIQAKARVAPLKDISIPRLELLSCTLGTRLAASVKNDLNLPDVRIYYLTDSMTALAWIQRTRDWGVFVFNRVKEIRNLSDVSSWEHVLSEKNFADILTRGCSAQQLIYLRWWEGEPSWLSENPVQCPRSKQVPDEKTINLELRKSVLVNTAKRIEEFNWHCKYFSSYLKVVRMIAWIFRFFKNAKRIDVCNTSEITFSEFDHAEKIVIKLIQMENLEGVTDEKLRPLKPFLDQFGILHRIEPIKKWSFVYFVSVRPKAEDCSDIVKRQLFKTNKVLLKKIAKVGQRAYLLTYNLPFRYAYSVKKTISSHWSILAINRFLFLNPTMAAAEIVKNIFCCPCKCSRNVFVRVRLPFNKI